MTCPGCRGPNPEGELFCGRCGEALAGAESGTRLYALAAGAVTAPAPAASPSRGQPVSHYAGHAALAAGAYREAAERFEKVLRSLRPARSGMPSIGAWIYLGLARAFLGEFTPAADAHAAAARELQAHPNAGAALNLTLYQGIAALLQSRWSAAAALLEPIAMDTGAPDSFPLGMAQVFGAWARAMTGSAADTRAAEEGLARLEALGALAGRSLWIAAHGEALRASGDSQRARASAERALALAAKGDRWGELLAERTLGQCLMDATEVDAAQVAGHLERAVVLGIERGARTDLAITRFHLAELCFLEENFDACRTELDQASWLALGLEMPWLRERAAELRARLPRRDAMGQPPPPPPSGG